jgi:putative membrane protein insertion efficiency factor
VSIVARLAVLMIRGYQVTLSPLLPSACRYQPTCSAYAIEAVERYGFVRGAWMGAWRILRCHPLARGGYDPVP